MLHNVIRIRGKTFDDLNTEEVALMIEADSSLTRDGNESFAACALDEFLYSKQVTRPDLLALRERILANIYIERPGTAIKEINRGFLARVAAELRSGTLVVPAKPT
jgi:hypothetical protein